MPSLPKEALKEELCAVLKAELETLEHAHRETNAGATHEEAKPENDKDTRALEQSYLARGQAQRVIELRNGLLATVAMAARAFRDTEPVTLGALVTVEEDDETQLLFIAPHGGGTLLAQGKVRVITPQSPLGRVLLGKRLGDDCELRLPERTRELSIVEIA
jgi:transcription elongation GreA/GreB family factor